MKSCVSIHFKTYFVFLALLACCSASARAAVSLSVTPASVTNFFSGAVVLQVSGLAAGQTVTFEKHLDINASGGIDTGDLLVQSFRITDGQTTSIGGVQNRAVPSDEDGAANGQVRTTLSFTTENEISRFVGGYIYRAASPAGSDAKVFSITQSAHPQKINGFVLAGRGVLPAALVIFTAVDEEDGEFVAGTISDASGAYTMNLPAGQFSVFAAKSNYMANLSTAPVISLAANQTVSSNLSPVFTTARTISGRIVDASNPSSGVPGVQLFFQSADDEAALTLSDMNGNFVVSVKPSLWEFGLANEEFTRLSLVGMRDEVDVDTTAGSVSNLVISLPRANALIHGSVKDEQGNGIAGARLMAMSQDNSYEATAVTDTGGNYAFGIRAGNGQLRFRDSNPALENYAVPSHTFFTATNNQAVAKALVVRRKTAAINGFVRNSSNQPIPGVEVIGFTMVGGVEYESFSMTDSNGAYSLGVFNGTWELEVNDEDLEDAGYGTATAPDVTVSGANQTANITVFPFTAHLAGKVVDSAGVPITGLRILAVRSQGPSSEAELAGDGGFNLGLSAGTWYLQLERTDALARGLLGPSLQFNLSDGTEITNIQYVVRQTTNSISGTVKQGNGTPVAGVWVYGYTTINGTDYNAFGSQTDAQGAYRLAVFAGEWGVFVDSFSLAALGFPPVESKTVNVSGAVQSVNFVVGSGTHLRGRVVDDTGAVVAGLGIFAYPDGGGSTTFATTDNNGNFDLNLRGGRWRVELAGDPQSGTPSRNLVGPSLVVDLVEGVDQNNLLVIAKRTTGQLSVSVRDGNGNAISGIAVFAHSALSSTNYNTGGGTKTDASGNAVLKLFNGNWSVSLSSFDLGERGFSPIASKSVDMTSSSQSVAFTASDLLAVADIAIYVLLKGQRHSQTTPTSVEPRATSQFRFQAIVAPVTATSVSAASLRLPNALSKVLQFDEGSWRWEDRFDTQAAMDTAYPNGGYTVIVDTARHGTKSLPLNLTGNLYPSPPRINNFQALQSIDPAQDVVVSWDAFSSGGVKDVILLNLENSMGEQILSSPRPGQAGVLSGSATSFVIPRGTLSSGQTYRGQVTFYKSSEVNTNSYQGALGFAAFFASTDFPISTGGAQDTTPPSLLSSNPANNATGVGLNSPVSFTFSEPMANAWSISWSGNVSANNFTYTWSGDRRTLTCTFNGNLPPNSLIRWTLNPVGEGQNLRDLAGNPLPSNISGQFTTGAGSSSGNVWTAKAPMSTARFGAGAEVINGILYVVGGSPSATEAYDPLRNTWTNLAPMPSGRVRVTTGVIRGKLYVAGGAGGDGAVLEIYDPVSNTWSAGRSMNISRLGAAGGVINDKFYVAGGTSDFTKTLEVYDPASDSWTLKTQMPTPRFLMAAGVVDGKLYVVGGANAVFGGGALGTLEVYNPITDSWETKASMPTARTDLAAGVLNGKLHAVGGFPSAHESYDPATDRWSAEPPMPTPRGDLAVAVLGNKLFAAGGTSGPGQPNAATLEVFSVPSLTEVTLTLKSDGNTLAVGLGSGAPSAATLARLDAGDTSGLTFQNAAVGSAGSTLASVQSAPSGTEIVNIPPSNGQNGFFKVTFVLPDGFAGVQLIGAGNADDYGRAFLNGNAISPPLLSNDPNRLSHNGSAQFAASNPAFFRRGTNELVIADLNAGGGPSAATFFAIVTYEPVIVPKLAIAKSASNVLLNWPQSAIGFQVESSAKATGPWSLVPNTPGTVGDQYSLLLPIAGQMQFYRLRK